MTAAPTSTPPMPPGRRAGRLLLRSAVGVLVLLSSTGCVKAGISPHARQVHGLFYIITWLALPVFLFVWGMLVFCAWRYRQRKGDTDTSEGIQDYGNKYAMGAFFAGPLIIIIIGLVFGEKIVANVDAIPPKPAERLVVTGSQWAWAANYVKEGLTVHGVTLKKYMTMELPVNEVSQIKLVSHDVIHEWYVPDLLYMKNAVPGHPNTFSVRPDRLGTYPAQCAQYCGLDHGEMKFTLKVVKPAVFKDWVAKQKQAVTKSAKNGCVSEQHGELNITAHHIQWNTACLKIDPNKKFTLELNNLDKGVAHNFAIWQSSKLKNRIYQSANVTGIAKKSFVVPALKPGKYYFQCDIHGPAMSGTLYVGTAPNGG
jgi:cytochrome c oxidase subunit 2